MAGLGTYQGVILAIVTIGILVGAGLLAMTSFRDALTAGSPEYNATNNWVMSQTNISDKAPTFGTLIGVGLIVLGAFFIFGVMRPGRL